MLGFGVSCSVHETTEVFVYLLRTAANAWLGRMLRPTAMPCSENETIKVPLNLLRPAATLGLAVPCSDNETVEVSYIC